MAYPTVRISAQMIALLKAARPTSQNQREAIARLLKNARARKDGVHTIAGLEEQDLAYLRAAAMHIRNTLTSRGEVLRAQRNTLNRFLDVADDLLG